MFCWSQPFRSTAEPDYLPAGVPRRGVILVHGFLCNRGVWNPVMRRLRVYGIPFVAVNLEPPFCPIDRYVDAVEAGVRRLELATGLPPVVVAHSMGGLAVRAWMAARCADDRVHRVARLEKDERDSAESAQQRAGWGSHHHRAERAAEYDQGSRDLDDIGDFAAFQYEPSGNSSQADDDATDRGDVRV